MTTVVVIVTRVLLRTRVITVTVIKLKVFGY